MKIHCPDCEAVYNISEHQIAGRTAKAVCRKCGAEIVVKSPSEDMTGPSESSDGKPEDAFAGEPAPARSKTAGRRKSKPDQYSVASLSPKYPKYRTPLIIVTAVLVLVGLLAGVHFAAKGTKNSLDRLFQDPIQYVANMLFGSEKMKLCGSFLDRNENRLAMLGGDLKYYPIKEETRVLNGRETATIVIRVQGTRATKDVIFRLEERKGEWEILEVVLDLGGARQQRLFP